ncbi:beta-L-arabinofuranosidase domain-containing protein [Caulobacter sp.]|uniref:beta-L-arabinofuranosidase domain-containing protein n=1 Tax=Caulobacter sp. TaxID=78 RepID=UPI003BAA3CEB
MTRISRRALMALSSGLMVAGTSVQAATATGGVEPYRLDQVRLLPSLFLTSVETNQRYLLSLDPDRLLHNFRKGAGLAPKGELYGGWEALGIAGHSLGHYLSAVSLTYAQTGDATCLERARYIVRELRAVQVAQGDGYAGGTTVDRDGRTVDGKLVYEELRRGEIRTSGFDLNGGWVPLYSYHKVFAGALDAHRLTGDSEALTVAVGLGDYLGGILERLTDEQIQQILRAEHGGLIECYAELHARTGQARWLTLARRVWHKAILDPLSEGRDELAGKHANTQIPKVVGVARLYDLTRDPRDARTARYFWETVTRDHSYVIGGNSDHEHFGAPRQLSAHLVQETCEACNTYNMLRLTRRLYGWSGEASYFDYFERAHLNHILAQQDPRTGMFSYFTPLASGLARLHSEPETSFWCCVGSGMESHAKHGESIYWRRGSRTLINLYYPSRLNAPDASLTISTDFPHDDEVFIQVERAPKELALRVPAWCAAPVLTVNGRPAGRREDGYLVLSDLKAGDRLALTLPMTLRAEAMPDDDRMVAFLAGPLVLAADLGAVDGPWQGLDPVIVADDAVRALKVSAAEPHSFGLESPGQPATLNLRPFYSQHRNRTAVYFRRYSASEWAAAEPGVRAETARRAAIRAATIDLIRLGEQQPEIDHNFAGTPNTATVSHIRDGGRWIQGGYLEFDLAVAPGPMALQMAYGGGDRGKDFRILIDGQLLVRETLEGPATGERQLRSYPLPSVLTLDKRKVRVRIEADRDQWTTAFEARMFRQEAAV